MNVRTFAIGLASLVLWGATPQAALAQRVCACADNADNLDHVSRLCLPAAIDGYETLARSPATRARDKQYRNTLSAGYDNRHLHLAITVYLYDRDASAADADAQEFGAVIGEILAVHRGATLGAKTRETLALAGLPTVADRAYFDWVEPGERVGSFLWLVPQGTRYLKVRATYARPAGDADPARQIAIDGVNQIVRAMCRPPLRAAQ